MNTMGGLLLVVLLVGGQLAVTTASECGVGVEGRPICPNGECCSTSGKCGTGPDECAAGRCQPLYGNCWPPPPSPPPPSPEPEKCGAGEGGHSCNDTNACCGVAGVCGFSYEYCARGYCQPGYGECYDWPKPDLCGPLHSDVKCNPETTATGGCCSVYGECGEHFLQCSQSLCNPDYGNCTYPPEPPAPELCGPDHDGAICPTGLCCSVYGKCGTGHFHCSLDYCLRNYGECDDNNYNKLFKLAI